MKHTVMIILVLSFVLALASSQSTDCTVIGSTDNLETIKRTCTDIVIANLTVPAGKTLDLTNLTDGTTVTFKGNVTFGYTEWNGYLITVGGNNIRVTGSPDHVLDGQGALWWDGLGGNGGKLKPKFFTAEYLYNSVIEDLYLLNSPKHCFSILFCQNVTLTRITFNNLDGDLYGGHNTDAFDIQNSYNITIDSNTVYSQDDCLAVNSGGDIYFSNNYCYGGHGISIGSVGGRDNNVVDGVYISDCVVEDSENGVRIKTKYNLTGSVSNIVYKNIVLKNMTDFGILIRQDYENEGPTGTPTGGIPITNFTLSNITGTVMESGTNVYVLVVNAANWYWSDINVVGGKVYRTCIGIPEGTGYVCESESSAKMSTAFAGLVAALAAFLLYSK